MKRLFIHVMLLVILAGNWSCQQDAVDPDVNTHLDLRPLSAAEIAIIRSSNQFSFNLFRELSQENNGNVFVSPLTINVALNMVMNGTSGADRESIRQTLNYRDINNIQANKAFNELGIMLNEIDPRVTFNVANAVWYNREHDINPLFKDLMAAYYEAWVEDVPFGNPRAESIINDWVDNKTQAGANNIISGTQSGDDVYFVNSINFKADWTYAFDKRKTRLAPFYPEPGSQTSCEMMYADLTVFTVNRTDSLLVADIPFGNKQYSMTVLMPEQDYSLSKLINNMGADQFDYLLSTADTVSSSLQLPKFKLSATAQLNQSLSSLGMQSVFSDQQSPDLSAMLEGVKKGKISQIIHQATIEIDEQGTTTELTSVVPDASTLVFDKPFVFVIREKFTNAILFTGKIRQPAQVTPSPVNQN
jgi:serine protease inhibitor